VSATSGVSFRGSEHLYLQSVWTGSQEINVSGPTSENIMRLMVPYALELGREVSGDSRKGLARLCNCIVRGLEKFL
jgi:hypothetical protein